MRRLGSKQTKRVTVCLGDEEYAYLETYYKNTGIPMGTYVRSLVKRERQKVKEANNEAGTY